MPHCNRVNPFGELVATPARGGFMGNRGILHDATGRLGKARWKHKVWIICVTEFRGRHRTVMSPNRYTELFFMDEPTALAAGHRPCFECRRADFFRYVEAWSKGNGWRGAERPRVKTIDDVLHRERAVRGGGRPAPWSAQIRDLPDGVIVTLPERPSGAVLLWRGHLLEWSFHGYRKAEKADPAAEMSVLTPPSTVASLAAGFQPAVDSSAAAAIDRLA